MMKKMNNHESNHKSVVVFCLKCFSVKIVLQMHEIGRSANSSYKQNLFF